MRPDFDEAMGGQVTSTADRLEPTPDHAVAVLAIDVDGRFGAAFRFGLAADGTYVAEAEYGERQSDGSWMELGAGGATYAGWDGSYERRTVPDDAEAIFVFGTAGLDVFPHDDLAVPLSAVIGFVAAGVTHVEVVTHAGRRPIAVPSPVGAFVAVVVDEHPFELIPLDEAGDRSGPSWRSDRNG